MHNIVWLASYPKSGNTWFRMFLANFFANQSDPLDINKVHCAPVASARSVVDELLGYDSSYLSDDELKPILPTIFNHVSNNAKETEFFKVHEAYISTGETKRCPIYPKEATKGVLYFIRNPLDVAVSFANHYGVTIDKAIGAMENEAYSIGHKLGKGYRKQAHQALLSWSSHVRSWQNISDIPVHIMRYEDMHSSATETFSKALRHLGIDANQDRVERALKNSSFERLKKQETQNGFKERLSRCSNQFFNRGQVGYWRECLTVEQIERVTASHSEVMKEFGYMDSSLNSSIHLDAIKDPIKGAGFVSKTD